MGAAFDALREGLGWVLAFIYDLIPVQGLAIMLLTIAINIVVFPLTLKQTRATRAFQRIQPEIKRIQKEHKDDPQEMQRQLMAAQKASGATPGGCILPLIVQAPIWIAMFWVLRGDLGSVPPNPARWIPESTALHQVILDGNERFLGMLLSRTPWEALNQLGVVSAIPYLLMLMLMVAAQYVQQWHALYGQARPTDQPGAAAQQALTKILPLFLGVISFNFPAGLVVYWATSTLFRLGQQVLIFKIDGRPPSLTELEAETKRKAAEKDKAEDSDKPEQTKKPQPSSSNKRRRRRRR